MSSYLWFCKASQFLLLPPNARVTNQLLKLLKLSPEILLKLWGRPLHPGLPAAYSSSTESVETMKKTSASTAFCCSFTIHWVSWTSICWINWYLDTYSVASRKVKISEIYIYRPLITEIQILLLLLWLNVYRGEFKPGTWPRNLRYICFFFTVRSWVRSLSRFAIQGTLGLIKYFHTSVAFNNDSVYNTSYQNSIRMSYNLKRKKKSLTS